MAELLTAKGTKRQFTAGPEGYPFPCTVIAGKEEGKTVLITAQIHSGEYPGTPALIRLAERLDPAELKGTLILIPCVNITGFYAGTNAYVPEDHGNLNAAYPGDPDTVTGRIAQYFVQELFPHADFVLDLHSGGMNEALIPCLFFPALKCTEESLHIAEQLDIPYLVPSYNTAGEMSYAANVMGIPGLLLERGYGGMCEEEWIRAYERDLDLFLCAMGMKEYADTDTCEKKIFQKAYYTQAQETGLWFPAVHAGQTIKKGELLGRTEDFRGRLLREYSAEADGIVLYYRIGMNAVQGDPRAADGY